MFRKKNLHITLPQPCHEKWEEMSETEKGRFCQSCQKEVIDFARMSDAEIVRFVKQTRYNFCGSFLDSQLDRDIVVAPKHASFKFKQLAATVVALLSFKFASGQSLQQPKQETTVTPQKADNKAPQKSVAPATYKISGKVSLQIKSKKELANVVIKIDQDKQSYKVDSNGRFSITLKEPPAHDYIVVAFSHPSLKREVRTIHRTQFPADLEVDLYFPTSGRTSGVPVF